MLLAVRALTNLERTPVHRLGVRQRDQVEVTSGLGAGETVVTSGQIRLRDGAAVQTATSADGGEG